MVGSMIVNSNPAKQADAAIALVASKCVHRRRRPSKPGEMQTIMVYATRLRESIPDRAHARARRRQNAGLAATSGMNHCVTGMLPAGEHRRSPSPKTRLPVRSASLLPKWSAHAACRNSLRANGSLQLRFIRQPRPTAGQHLFARMHGCASRPDIIFRCRGPESSSATWFILRGGFHRRRWLDHSISRHCRGAGAASGAAVVVVHFHEGLCTRGG